MFVYNSNCGIYAFTELENLGVLNFCTTQKQGNLSFKTDPVNAHKNIQDIIQLMSVKKNKNDTQNEFFFVMATEGADQIDELTKENILLYNKFSSQGYERLTCDAIVTDQSTWIIVCPADCMIMVLIGQKKGKKHISLVHLGFTGVILDLHKKMIRYYKQNNIKVSKGFVFPYIHGESYILKRADDRIQHIYKNKNWDNYLTPKNKEEFEVHFGLKVIHEMQQHGIQIIDANIDTFTATQEKIFYSNYYSNKNNIDLGYRFAVGVKLMK